MNNYNNLIDYNVCDTETKILFSYQHLWGKRTKKDVLFTLVIYKNNN